MQDVRNWTKHDNHQVFSEPRVFQAEVGHDTQTQLRDGLPEDELLRDRPDGGATRAAGREEGAGSRPTAAERLEAERDRRHGT